MNACSVYDVTDSVVGPGTALVKAGVVSVTVVHDDYVSVGAGRSLELCDGVENFDAHGQVSD